MRSESSTVSESWPMPVHPVSRSLPCRAWKATFAGISVGSVQEPWKHWHEGVQLPGQAPSLVPSHCSPASTTLLPQVGGGALPLHALGYAATDGVATRSTHSPL